MRYFVNASRPEHIILIQDDHVMHQWIEATQERDQPIIIPSRVLTVDRVMRAVEYGILIELVGEVDWGQYTKLLKQSTSDPHNPSTN